MIIAFAYCASICDNVLYIARAIDLIRRICTFLGQLLKSGDLKREALTINSMPVERVDLGI
jgi:hypothetical protein